MLSKFLMFTFLFYVLLYRLCLINQLLLKKTFIPYLIFLTCFFSISSSYNFNILIASRIINQSSSSFHICSLLEHPTVDKSIPYRPWITSAERANNPHWFLRGTLQHTNVISRRSFMCEFEIDLVTLRAYR